MGFRKRECLHKRVCAKSDNRSSAKVIMGKPASKLTKEEKKILSARMAEIRSENGGKNTVQNTIPFLCMYQDGVCQVSENSFSLTVQFYDANYSIAEFDEQKVDLTYVINAGSAKVNQICDAFLKAGYIRKDEKSRKTYCNLTKEDFYWLLLEE